MQKVSAESNCGVSIECHDVDSVWLCVSSHRAFRDSAVAAAVQAGPSIPDVFDFAKTHLDPNVTK